MSLNRRNFVKMAAGAGAGLFVPVAFAAVNARNGVSVNTGSTINGRTPNSAVNGQSLASSAAWTDSFAEGSIDDSIIYGGSSTAYTTHTITLPSGTVSKLRFKVTTFSFSAGVKLALYDASNNLVGSGAVTISATGIAEVTLTPAAVSSGDHSISLCSNAGYDDFRFGTLGGQTNASWENYSQTYAGFPPGTRPANEGNVSEKIWFGAYIS